MSKAAFWGTRLVSMGLSRACRDSAGAAVSVARLLARSFDRSRSNEKHAGDHETHAR